MVDLTCSFIYQVKHFQFNHTDTEFYKNTHTLTEAASANVNTHKTEKPHVKSPSMQMKIQICPEFTWIQEKYHCFFQRFQLRPIWHKEIRGLRHQVHKELAGKVSGGSFKDWTFSDHMRHFYFTDPVVS